MPQAYFIREAYFTLRSNISLVPQGTNFIEKDDCSRNRLFLVPVTGVEPVRYRYHWILSPARLPIPSHRQISKTAPGQ